MRSFFIGLMVVLFIFVTSLAAAAAPVKLTYANFLPASTFGGAQMERWKAEAESRSNGELAIETHAGGSLLGPLDMMDGVIQGKADIGCFTTSYLPERFVILNALSLPLKIPNARVGSLVLWDLYKKHKPKSMEKVKVLTMFTTAPACIMSVSPVRTLGDLNGMALRSPGSGKPILGAWGAQAKAMPIGQTKKALKKGDVQGVFTSLDFMQDFNFAEDCPFVTETNTVVYPLVVVMNLDKWNSLSENTRKALDKLGEEHVEWTGRNWDMRVTKSLEWSRKEYNTQISKVSKAEEIKFNFRLTPIVSNWIKYQKAKGIKSNKIVMDIRGFIRNYSR